MHRWLLFLAACSYNPPTTLGGDNEPGPDGAVPLIGTCNSLEDPALCIEFEEKENDLFFEGSMNQFGAKATDLLDMSRLMSPAVVDHKAVGFGPTSKLAIDRDLALDGDVTVGMWMQRGLSVTRGVMFDSSSRFFMSFGTDNQVRCGINDSSADELRVDSASEITNSDWHHVACSFDSAAKQLKVFIDGAVAGCKTLDATIVARAGGTTIGAPHGAESFEHFIGALDGIHVYKRVLEPADVCSTAGGIDCAIDCPSSGEAGGGGGQGSGQGGGDD